MYFSLSTITFFATVAAQVAFVFPAPINSRQTNVARAAADGLFPRFVMYTDKRPTSETDASGLPSAAGLQGANTLNLGFLLTSGKPADQSAVWAGLAAGQRTALKKTYSDAGIKVMVSAFGGTEEPTTDGADPAQTGKLHADFVKTNNLDGIDVDYEDLPAVAAGTAVAWVVTYMKSLHTELAAGGSKFLISHAPLAPHFAPTFEGGPYLKIDKQVGKFIDWYNIQYYNDNTYEDCAQMIEKSTNFPGSALNEIKKSGIAANKLIIGKPVHADDASNGIMTPDLLGQCVAQAVSAGDYKGGVMGFQFTDAASNSAFFGPSAKALGA